MAMYSVVHKFRFNNLINGNFDTSVATKNRSRAGLGKVWSQVGKTDVIIGDRHSKKVIKKLR